MCTYYWNESLYEDTDTWDLWSKEENLLEKREAIILSEVKRPNGSPLPFQFESTFN